VIEQRAIAMLHLLGPPAGLPVDAVMRGRARPQRILEQYDDLLRTAASLKRGWVPASLPIARLKNATPQSPLAAALSEHGRIVRTNFLLVYCADPAERARIAGQLNKGETLHALRRHLVIGSRAQSPPTKTTIAATPSASRSSSTQSRSGNVRYMTASIDHLHATKPDIVADATAIARVAPVTHAHVSSLGRYDLHRQPPPAGHSRRRGRDRDGFARLGAGTLTLSS
jgi:Tn3 transposase DDE domain